MDWEIDGSIAGHYNKNYPVHEYSGRCISEGKLGVPVVVG
jgi:hypothetical protein